METRHGSSTRAPMLFNGAFSLASGALFASAPGTVAGWLGVDAPGWIRLFGLALLAHGAILFWAAARADRDKWARLNLAAIVPYPLLIIALVVFGVVDRPLGQGLALLDGAAIAAVAVWHWVSLREPAAVPRHQVA